MPEIHDLKETTALNHILAQLTKQLTVSYQITSNITSASRSITYPSICLLTP